MRRHVFLASLLPLLLAACGAAPRADGANAPATPLDRGTGAAAASPARPTDNPGGDVPPATVPDAAQRLQAAAHPARFDGFGPLRFGMDLEAVRAAWPGRLNGGADERETCRYLNPVVADGAPPPPTRFALMIEDGRFVRYDVGDDGLVAPGGGRVGMSDADIRRLYPGLEQRPHAYVEGGHYLRVPDPDGGAGVLVFETDADGTVTEWRAGLAPQVDYIEGCS